MLTLLNCERCGNDFTPLSGNVNRFCSMQCRNSYNSGLKSTEATVCTGCGVEFYGRVNGKAQHYCTADCRKANRMYVSLYGITLKQRNDMRAAQGYRCAICTRHEDETGTMKVDHDHDTGVVRQMLCHGCNVAIGHLQDDPEVVASALAYLLQHKGVEA